MNVLSNIYNYFFTKTKNTSEDILCKLSFVVDKNNNINYDCAWLNNNTDTAINFANLLYSVNSGKFSESILQNLTLTGINNIEDREFIHETIKHWNAVLIGEKNTSMADKPVVRPLGAFFKNAKV